ncbi:hypothetical protein N9N67_03855 [Bacteriovoracaceae bacterium]|nr:hypothetical protein [Bacteriovoracaceae bacterium]
MDKLFLSIIFIFFTSQIIQASDIICIRDNLSDRPGKVQIHFSKHLEDSYSFGFNIGSDFVLKNREVTSYFSNESFLYLNSNFEQDKVLLTISGLYHTVGADTTPANERMNSIIGQINNPKTDVLFIVRKDICSFSYNLSDSTKSISCETYDPRNYNDFFSFPICTYWQKKLFEIDSNE